MANELNRFYDYLSGTSVRLAHQWECTLSPEGAGVESILGDSPFRFFCRSATLPEMTVNTSEISYQGINFRVPTSMTYGSGTIPVSVLCDSGMEMHTAFINWKNVYADNMKGGGGFKGLPNTSLKLDLLDQELKAVQATYILMGVFPSTVGGFTLSQDPGNPLTFDTTLTYQYWYLDNDGGDPVRSNQGAGGLNSAINAVNKIAGLFK